MTPTAIRSGERVNADQYVTWLASAVRQMGYDATIVEPSTRLMVSLPHGRAYMSETVSLRPNDNNELMWWWSWNKPIGPAANIADVAALVADVVEVTRG